MIILRITQRFWFLEDKVAKLEQQDDLGILLEDED